MTPEQLAESYRAKAARRAEEADRARLRCEGARDFAERRQLRERETVHWYTFPDAPGPDMRCHTEDRPPFQPSWEHVHELEARLESVRAKCVGMLVLGIALGVCFGYWVLPQWVGG